MNTTIKDRFFKYLDENAGKFTNSDGLYIYYNSKRKETNGLKHVFQIGEHKKDRMGESYKLQGLDGSIPFVTDKSRLVQIPSAYWLETFKSCINKDHLEKAKVYFTKDKLSGTCYLGTNTCSEWFQEKTKTEYNQIFTEKSKRVDEAINSINKVKYKPKGKFMTKIKDRNVEAAKSGAKIAAGKAINAVVMSKVKPQLPMMVRGYADTPIGAIVIANMVSAGVDQFMPENRKARQVADLMLDASMTEFFSNFNIEKMFSELLASANIENLSDVIDGDKD